MKEVPYKEFINSFMYAMVAIRPNLSNSLSVINQFMSNPYMEHWVATKKNLQGTPDLWLQYSKDGG